jgi:hypothetical protein
MIVREVGGKWGQVHISAARALNVNLTPFLYVGDIRLGSEPDIHLCPYMDSSSFANTPLFGIEVRLLTFSGHPQFSEHLPQSVNVP